MSRIRLLLRHQNAKCNLFKLRNKCNRFQQQICVCIFFALLSVPTSSWIYYSKHLSSQFSPPLIFSAPKIYTEIFWPQIFNLSNFSTSAPNLSINFVSFGPSQKSYSWFLSSLILPKSFKTCPDKFFSTITLKVCSSCVKSCSNTDTR